MSLISVYSSASSINFFYHPLPPAVLLINYPQSSPHILEISNKLPLPLFLSPCTVSNNFQRIHFIFEVHESFADRHFPHSYPAQNLLVISPALIYLHKSSKNFLGLSNGFSWAYLSIRLQSSPNPNSSPTSPVFKIIVGSLVSSNRQSERDMRRQASRRLSINPSSLSLLASFKIFRQPSAYSSFNTRSLSTPSLPTCQRCPNICASHIFRF